MWRYFFINFIRAVLRNSFISTKSLSTRWYRPQCMPPRRKLVRIMQRYTESMSLRPRDEACLTHTDLEIFLYRYLEYFEKQRKQIIEKNNHNRVLRSTSFVNFIIHERGKQKLFHRNFTRFLWTFHRTMGFLSRLTASNKLDGACHEICVQLHWNTYISGVGTGRGDRRTRG